jgi:hypothetical protein
MSRTPERKENPATRQRVGVISQFRPWAKMVGWYDPMQLIRTGVDVLISSIFGQYADRRTAGRRGGSGADAATPYDFTVDDAGELRSELWLDYVSDLGDGWHSTYNVAYAVTRSSLSLPDASANGASLELPRADVMIFGGDQVYPVASRALYQDRLVRPYEAALRDSEAPHPHLFAVPGNHDWYDNLVAFTSLFCSGRWFAGWRTQQRRSYFALKLPHNWWLIGADVQLASDIDMPQLEYFKAVAEQMGPDDRVILCVPEPHWIYAQAYGKYDDNCNESNLAFLEERVFQRKTCVCLAGDLHHYRRHADRAGAQKITCGGGGAFLYPTHGEDVDSMRGGYTLQSAYPPPDVSRVLCRRNFLFSFLNPRFGLVTGALYMLIAWATKVDLSGFGVLQYREVIGMSVDGLVASQAATSWAVLLCAGFIIFTDTHSKLYRWIAGPLHALAHMAAVLMLGWLATFVTVGPLGMPFGSAQQLLLAGAMIFISGWIVGPTIVGLYFFLSLNVFHRHAGEAFSALHIEDWKSFLRIKVDDQGVTIFPIGIERVWKAWRVSSGGVECPEWLPDETAPARKRGTQPTLIEPPIFVSREC